MQLWRVAAAVAALAGGPMVLAGTMTYDYGDWNAYGDGQVRTVVRYGDGNLSGYGFEITRAGVTGPDLDHGIHLEYGAAGIPIDHVDVHFQPEGHPGGPGDTYWAAPHFDFHFFTVSHEERETMTDEATAYQSVSSGLIPQDYMMAPGSFVPGEGTHWFTPSDFGAEFDHSSIYGFYGGEMSFVEPMVAQSYMDEMAAGTSGSISATLNQPDFYRNAGYWAQRWTMDYDSGTEVYTVMLDDLVWGDVPAPGALALLGIGALVGPRRRRS